METRNGFTKMNVIQFEGWLNAQSIGRTIINVQQHHTYKPDYSGFNGNNHFDLQSGMRNHHVHRNGWRDIGQHFTIFPDGAILTGRGLEHSPACIYGNNQGSICIENLGYFDSGFDVMNSVQRDAIIKVTAVICRRLNLPLNTNSIIYHHWFRMSDGVRNDGSGGNKSCPGTNFFGGNKVEDCERNFLPLLAAELDGHQLLIDDSEIERYVIVTANWLNVRLGPAGTNSLAPNRSPVQLGSVLRVYEEKNNWLRIAKSKNHWVFSRHTSDVSRYFVRATTLNVRSGPGIDHARVGQVYENDQVFIIEEVGNWAKIAMDDRWVSKNFIRTFK